MNKVLFFTLSTGLLLFTLLFTQSTSWAAEDAEKIFIDADHMQLNIETGFSVYTGNVKIRQGELKLTGDKVTLQQSNNEIERITVVGKPAHYNHVTEKGENIQAESERMVYTASKNKLVMTINAKLKQPDHQVSSQKIVYDTKKKIVIAGDKKDTSWSGSDSDLDSNANQRVNITLTPKKEPVTE
jgi:lipopolysaccharide export system protein LptA